MDQPQVRALDRLDHLAGALVQALGGQRLRQFPVAVHATGARRLAQQLTRPLGQEVPQRGEPVGLVDVQPQEARVRDRVLVAVRPGARRDADERLLARPAVEPLERVLA